MPKVSAIVLAAGLSSRMGKENKLFLDYKGKWIISYIIDQIEKSIADEIIIISSELSHEILKKNLTKPIKIVKNPNYKQGMTTSIQMGVSSANGDGYMICLGDMPKIKTEDYNLLIKSFRKEHHKNNHSIIVPFYYGQKGNPVILPYAYKEEILNHTEMDGCKSIIEKNSINVIQLVMPNDRILVDIDYPEEYRGLTTDS